VRADQAPVRLDLVRPRCTLDVTWHLELEIGRELTAQVDFQTLPCVDSTQMGAARLQRRTLTLVADIPEGYHVYGLGTMAPCATSS
jgi:hypothetical protein